MKKSIAFACMALVLAGSMFAASKKKSKDANSIKLGIWPEDTLTADIAMHEEYVKTFNTFYPNMTVVPAYYKYATDNFVPLASSGQLPTIYDTWFTEPQKIINQGFAKDITKEVKELGWDKKMNPGVLDLLSKKGKIYGVPRDAYALGLMINVDLFKQAGLVDKDGLQIIQRHGLTLQKRQRSSKKKQVLQVSVSLQRTMPVAGTLQTLPGTLVLYSKFRRRVSGLLRLIHQKLQLPSSM